MLHIKGQGHISSRMVQRHSLIMILHKYIPVLNIKDIIKILVRYWYSQKVKFTGHHEWYTVSCHDIHTSSIKHLCQEICCLTFTSRSKSRKIVHNTLSYHGLPKYQIVNKRFCEKIKRNGWTKNALKILFYELHIKVYGQIKSCINDVQHTILLC